MFIGQIDVFLREGISDPEGYTIADAAVSLGFTAVKGVEAGKTFKVYLDVSSEPEARELVDSLAKRLLSNPVIQRYQVVSLESKP